MTNLVADLLRLCEQHGCREACEAIDALEAKDKEIERLKIIMHDLVESALTARVAMRHD